MTYRSMLAARFAVFEVKERRSFWRLTAVLFLVYLATGLWSPLLAVYAQSLGAGTRDIGLVFGAYQATSLLTQYWWGRRSDRLGRRKPLLLWGTAGMALAYCAIAAVQGWPWLFAIRVGEGIALAAYSTGSLALMGDLLEDQQRRGQLMGLYRTFGSLAFAAAALGGGQLADRAGVRVPFWLAAACYAGAFLLVTQVVERGGTPTERSRLEEASQEEPSLAPATAALAHRALWPFLGLTFTWTFAMSAVVSLWPVYMQNAGYTKTAVGGLWGLAALGEAPCFLLAGYLSDRWGHRRVLLTGLLLMAGIFLAYTISTALVWMIAVQMVRSLAYACFEAPALLYTTELGLRRQRGRLASFYYSAGGLGGITGNVAGGAAAQWAGLPAMFRGVVLLMVVGALTAGRLMPGLRTTQPAPTDGDQNADPKLAEGPRG